MTNSYTASIKRRDCSHEVTKFVHENNLCRSTDPGSYMSSARELYTCVNRCGSRPVFGKIHTECGCDKSCVLHFDCCRDFSTACPELHSQSESLDFRKKGVWSMCFDNVFKVFTEFQTLPPQKMDFTTQMTTEKVSELSHLPPYQPRTLAQYSKFFRHYRAIDVPTGYIFNNFFNFFLHSQSVSPPILISKIVSLDCFLEAFGSINRSIGNTLKWCVPQEAKDALTPYHRACALDDIIACRCGNGETYKNHLHNACIGRNKSIPREVKYKLNKQLNQLYVPIPEDVQCGMRTVHESAYYENPAPRSRVVTGDVIMTISPFITNWDSVVAMGGGDSPGPRVDDQLMRDMLTNTDVDFTVELTTTLERRLRCSKLTNLLSECDLEECAEGALISQSRQSRDQFRNGLSCISPVWVTVAQPFSAQTAPLCTCLRVVSALTELNIWDITLKHSENSLCSIHLTHRLKDKEEVFTSADTPITSQFPNSLLSPAKPSVHQRLQNELFQSENLCDEQLTQEPLLVCFLSPVEPGQSIQPRQCYLLTSVRGARENDAFSLHAMFKTLLTAATFAYLLFIY
ncbi:hypothetical protein RRG08_017252 [Elysia crispata]|uniref:SMB domain-containing protein n=1 Tax=Elysia crispata TaxID=231223 RepID=A0AAE0Y0G6_9GAST|nr:hypothetical protein RRG08_017252 [Elysia crispata]